MYQGAPGAGRPGADATLATGAALMAANAAPSAARWRQCSATTQPPFATSWRGWPASHFAWTGGTFRAVAGDAATTADRPAPTNRGALTRQPAAPRRGGHLLLKNPTN